ncbi:unnamed protein product [Bemisia tabaci]|uniref:C2H2-type domain-containing protein n=1 Tax=Bemisia tabaci TaxID=7038 RepID=A0A9P0F0H9_BEMTA|nr:unnamed protein product [Bemisia tabaci]
MPRCWECSLVINNLRSFASHFRYHNKDSKDRAFCIEDECGKKQFANLSSLLRHYRTVHPVPTPTPPQQLQTLLNEAEPMHLSDDDVSLEHNLNDEMNSSVDSQEVSAEPHELPDNLNCVIASEVDIFISKLYKNKNITRGEVQEIINYTGGLLRGLGEVLRPVVFKVLERANASSDELYSMEDAFEILENPFENLRSEYMRVKTFKEEGTYIEPVPILLGTTLGTSNIRDEHQIHMDRLTAQHIPLSVTLKKFLEQPGIINKLLNYVQEVVSEKTFLLSYIHAKNWSNFDPRGKTFLPLFLYSDDFECGNCIGTHRTIHKITGLFDTGIALSCKMSEVEGFNLIVNATPPEDSSIQVVPWVKIKGTVYKKNMILVSGYHDHDLPIFAQIKTILLTSSDSVAFVCSSIKTLCFDLHYYAFEVQHEEHIYTYVKLADIPHDFPTAIHLSGDRRPFITYCYVPLVSISVTLSPFSPIFIENLFTLFKLCECPVPLNEK